MNDKTLNLTSTQIFELCENADFTNANLVYDPETNTLTVICNGDNTLYEGECDALTYAKILTGIINDPRWITANTKEPANIAVECGNYR